MQSLKNQEALRLLRAQHDATLSELENTHAELLRAEKALDRVQSSTVAAIAGASTPTVGSAAMHMTASGSGVRIGKQALTLSPQLGQASPLPLVDQHMNGTAPTSTSASPQPPSVEQLALANAATASLVEVHQGQRDEMEQILALRQRDIDDLRRDRVRLGKELDSMKMKVSFRLALSAL